MLGWAAGFEQGPRWGESAGAHPWKRSLFQLDQWLRHSTGRHPLSSTPCRRGARSSRCGTSFTGVSTAAGRLRRFRRAAANDRLHHAGYLWASASLPAMRHAARGRRPAAAYGQLVIEEGLDIDRLPVYEYGVAKIRGVPLAFARTDS